MASISRAEDVAFLGSLVHRFPALLPVLQEHLDDHDGEILPHLLMADIGRWLVARLVEFGPEDGFLRRILHANEDQFGRGDPVDNLIAVSFVENLPAISEAGNRIRALLGPQLSAQLRRWDRGE